MGLGGISIPSLLIILVIVLLLFGTKKLRNLGGDLGGAIKGFKKAVTDDEKNAEKLEDKHDPIDEAGSATEEQKAESDKTESK